MKLAEEVRGHWKQFVDSAPKTAPEPKPQPELSLEASIKALRQEFIAEIPKRLRTTGIGGRYGGEEFVMILPNCPPDQAATILNDLRIRFGQVRHGRGDGEFTADAALYEAKKRGRNRVIMATGEIKPSQQ